MRWWEPRRNQSAMPRGVREGGLAGPWRAASPASRRRAARSGRTGPRSPRACRRAAPAGPWRRTTGPRSLPIPPRDTHTHPITCTHTRASARARASPLPLRRSDRAHPRAQGDRGRRLGLAHPRGPRRTSWRGDRPGTGRAAAGCRPSAPWPWRGSAPGPPRCLSWGGGSGGGGLRRGMGDRQRLPRMIGYQRGR